MLVHAVGHLQQANGESVQADSEREVDLTSTGLPISAMQKEHSIMTTYLQHLSFLASIACTSPGYRGRVEASELKPVRPGGNPFQPGEVLPNQTGWVTATDFPLSPQPFWFGCFRHADGSLGYEIRRWARHEAYHNYRLDLSQNSYVGLYAPGSEPLAHWWMGDVQFNGFTVEPGLHSRMHLLANRKKPLRAHTRRQVRDHWYCFLNAENGDVLEFTLDIQSVGEERR